MARSISDIYNALIAEKESLGVLSGLQPAPDEFQTFLQDLASTSKVAIWRLFLYVVAFGHWVIEVLFDNHVAQVNDLKFKLITGTPRWYRQKALEFQYGDSLEWNGAQFVYPTINPANQIVKRAAVVSSGGIVRVKVAKLDVDGITPIPLTAGEIVSFTTYMEQIAFAGINVLTISTDPDDLILHIKVYYDPLVLTPSGESIQTAGVFPVEDAVNGYISDLPFNGVLNLTALVDRVQQALGVVDPVLQNAQARYGANAFAPIVDNYTSFAGHMTIHEDNPLNTTLTYVEAP